MRNTRALIMILASVVLGIVAMILARDWIDEQTKIKSRKIMVVSRDINMGTRLTVDMLDRIDWPSDMDLPGSFNDISQVEGRVIKVPFVKGEPILESKLAPSGSSGGLSSVITEGKRAITVKVNEVIGVAGFALPGNLVDILVSARDEKRTHFSKLVLEQILVLAVAQDVGRDDTKPKVVTAVTLEVTPEQAETLDLARGIGTLSLVLRNQVDKDYVETKGRRINDLMKPPPMPDDVVVERKIHRVPVSQSVSVIRGLSRSNTQLN